MSSFSSFVKDELSGVGFLELGIDEFDLALPESEDIFVHGPFDGLREELLGPCEAAEEDYGLRRRECDEISKFLAEDASRELEDLEGEFVAFLGSLIDIL